MFSIAVPQRAMQSLMLLYAICTASARHLTSLWFKERPNTVVTYDGVLLPDLNEDSAIYYHNACLGLLMGFSNDPTQESAVDVLAATTILRFYEQVDCKYLITYI